jgi:hypothetical protein
MPIRNQPAVPDPEPGPLIDHAASRKTIIRPMLKIVLAYVSMAEPRAIALLVEEYEWVGDY